MLESDRSEERAIRERAYIIWEHEGRPEKVRAEEHWQSAIIDDPNYNERGRDDDFMEDEEKILAGRPDANMPALLTKDVRGG